MSAATFTREGWDCTVYPTGVNFKLVARRGSAVCHIEKIAPDALPFVSPSLYWARLPYTAAEAFVDPPRSS